MARPELDELFAAWRAEPVAPERAAPALARAGTAVVAGALRQVAERRRRQRRLRNAGWALAVAAGVMGLGLSGWAGLRGSTEQAALSGPRLQLEGQMGEVAVLDSAGQIVSASSSLSEGDGLRTEQGQATLGFPSGAAARVASQSSLRVTGLRETEGLFLTRGRVDVEVPKLDPTRGFSVQTPDARVTVHGTQFSVNVEATPRGPETHVSVTHGIVSVQRDGREVRLHAGESWPPEPEPEAALEVAAEPEVIAASEPLELTEERPAPRRQRKAARGRLRASGMKAGSRELAEQNEWFARAMNLKKNGAPEAALSELTELLERYPTSPLTQELRVERLRLLRSLPRSEDARAEARRYLRDFPKGYAEREAREILGEQP
jgi:ferric-dicitrate binding protein FerR (iron transport regulator)